MKKSLILSLLMIATTVAFSQSALDKWPEMKSFHSVMAQTFHPSEEGDLKPIKARIGEFVTKAEAAQKSTIPADIKTDQLVASLDRLAAGSKELQVMIDKKESDEAITKKLSSLHDNFHEIAGMCRKDDGHEHGDGDGHSPKEKESHQH